MSETSNPRAVIGNNVATFDQEKNDRLAKEFFLAARENERKGSKMVRTAQQEAAAACMFHHAVMVAQAGSVKIASLASAFTSASAKKTLLDAMVKHFTGSITPPKVDSFGVPPKEQMERLGEWQRGKNVLKRGLELASVLAIRGVTTASYNPRTNMWELAPQMFAHKEFDAKVAMDKVPLDGRMITSHRPTKGSVKEKWERFTASVETLKRIYRDDNKKPGSGNQTNAGQGSTTGGATGNGKPIDSNDMMLVADAGIAYLTDRNKLIHRPSGALPNIVDYGTREIEALGKLVAEYNKLIATPGFMTPRVDKQAPKPEAKPVQAKPEAKVA